jgi:Restriction endonuclease
VRLKTPRPSIIIQCKAHNTVIGPGAVWDLFGTLMHHNADEAGLIAIKGFQNSAVSFAEGKQFGCFQFVMQSSEIDWLMDHGWRLESPGNGGDGVQHDWCVWSHLTRAQEAAPPRDSHQSPGSNKRTKLPQYHAKPTPETEEKANRANEMHNLRLICNQGGSGVRTSPGPPILSILSNDF